MIPHQQSIGGQFTIVLLKTLLAATDQPLFIENDINPIPRPPSP